MKSGKEALVKGRNASGGNGEVVEILRQGRTFVPRKPSESNSFT